MPTLTDTYIRHIRTAYPELGFDPAHITLTGGQFSDVLIVDDALIFRFPKSPTAAEEVSREIPILKALQGKLPLPIPNLQYVVEDAGRLAFMGYPMIPGAPLLREAFAAITDNAVLEQMAAELAGFLKALHTLPPETLPVSKPYDARAEWRQTFSDFEAQLFPYMRPDARQQVTDDFERALNDSILWDFHPCVCHGDFGAGNILYADGHVSGIIDFTFCGIGDPAQDLGALLTSYGEAFIERLFAYYPELRAALPRTRFIVSTYTLWQAWYALRDGNQDDFDDGMRAYI